MITVTGCRLLVKPFSVQEHDKIYARAKAMGLELPQGSERKEQANVDKGTVLQIGAKCHEDYVGDLSVGDVVGFAKFGGKYIQEPKTEELFLVINDEDLVCIFKED